MMYLGRGGVNRIRRLVSSDPWAKSVAAEILQRADALHEAPLIEPQIRNRAQRSCFRRARALAERVHTFGMAWFLEGRSTHTADGSSAELEAAAQFPDWNRTHFIDTAEMMAAVALGRDWLRGFLTASQQKAIDAAIVRHGLIPAAGIAARRIGVDASGQQLEHRLLRRRDRGGGGTAVGSSLDCAARSSTGLRRP